MSTISERARGIAESVTLAVTAKAKQIKKEGINVISFGAGEPDYDTPQNIKEAAVQAIKEGFTKYTASGGIPELKSAVCEKFWKDNKIRYEQDEVLISCGGKHSLFNAMETLLDRGDEAILPSPYWITYEEQIRIAGAKPVIVDTSTTEFRLTAESVEKALSKNTKLLILNSPSNPTGAVITEEELKKIARLAEKNNFFIISDEVYEKLIYTGRHVSIASLGEDIRKRTITINSVSKTYSMTGWRIGYCGGPKKIISAMGNLQSHSTSNPCSIAQKAAVEALRGPQDFSKWIMLLDERRRYMVEKLNEMKGIKCMMPEGAFYAFPDIQDTGIGSMEFSERLLEEEKVAVIPGKAFGAMGNVRLSYATSLENIKEGLERMKRFCR